MGRWTSGIDVRQFFKKLRLSICVPLNASESTDVSSLVLILKTSRFVKAENSRADKLVNLLLSRLMDVVSAGMSVGRVVRSLELLE